MAKGMERRGRKENRGRRLRAMDGREVGKRKRKHERTRLSATPRGRQGEGIKDGRGGSEEEER